MSRAGSTRSTKLLIGALVLVSAILISSTAATTFLAGDAARRVTEDRFGYNRIPYWRVAQTDLARYDEHRRVGSASALIDSVVAGLGDSVPLDSASLRRIIGVVTGVPARDLAVWIDLAGATRLDDATDLILFRRWARARRLQNFWGYRSGFADAGSVYAIPIRAMQPLKRLVVLNEAAADSALAVGDVQAATERALENIGAARQLLDQPLTMDMLVGRVFLQDGARLLERIGRQAHDTATSALAVRLDSIANTTYRLTGNETRRMFAVDDGQRGSGLGAIAGDRALHPAIRLMALQAVIDGACVHTREMLTGVSSSRRVTLEQLLLAVRDIPRADELAPLYRRSLNQFDTPSGELLQRSVGHAAAESPIAFLTALSPRSVRHRVAYCRMLM